MEENFGRGYDAPRTIMPEEEGGRGKNKKKKKKRWE